MTQTEQRDRGLDLAVQVQGFLRERLVRFTERAREGRANHNQVRDARAAYVAARRAVRTLERRFGRRTA